MYGVFHMAPMALCYMWKKKFGGGGGGGGERNLGWKHGAGRSGTYGRKTLLERVLGSGRQHG